MTRQNFPGISAVITTYNEENKIRSCLKALTLQHYPKEKLEIILVDDDSTDATVEIARKFGVKILKSGKRILDISKAIGISHARNRLVLFLDADNILPDRNYLIKITEPFVREKGLAGSYPYRFFYGRKDHPANRYCSLFGINDPFQYYTKSREHFTYASDKWQLPGNAIDKGDYYIAQFPPSSRLTLGAIGFMAPRSALVKYIRNGFFFHSDAFNDLVSHGHNRFAVVKTDIIHNHAGSHGEFFRKLARNFRNYLRFRKIRPNNWARKTQSGLIKSIIIMTTFIIPAYDALKGFVAKPDRAWFLHPFYCAGVVMLYIYITLKSKVWPKSYA